MRDLLGLKEEVLRTAKAGYREGLFKGTSGNLSARDPVSGLVVITPTSLPYDSMASEDLVVMDIEGRVVEGARKPSSEWSMHLRVYRGREDVFAVFHTHSPYATSFAVLRKPVPPVLTEMIPFIGGDIPVAEFALPGSDELGIKVVRALEGRGACLLANHGVVAIGASLKEAYLRAVYVEDAARIYHHALAVGTPCFVPEDAIRKIISPAVKG
ncbi:MAG: class II aldolase/adducin family protein [Bacillota bacterium]|jgi:L-ribulose-5-phosphate 4-epimerase|nr:class II aldolase/adducin family protein [Candidatus Fermentithermobacillaceae bacterium]